MLQASNLRFCIAFWLRQNFTAQPVDLKKAAVYKKSAQVFFVFKKL